MKSHLKLALDTLFYAFITFIACFILLYYFVDRVYAIVFAIILTLPITAVIFKHTCRKEQNKSLTKKRAREVELTCLKLSFYTIKEQCDLFESAINSKNYQTKQKNQGVYIPTQNCAIFPMFSFDNVTKADVVKIFNQLKSGQSAYILCQGLPSATRDFLLKFNGRINAVDKVKVYELLLETNSLPQTKVGTEEFLKQKPRAKLNLLQKNKCAKYLLFGLSFLFMSFLVPIKLYYIIIGCLFLILSILSKLFGTENAKN